MSRYQITGIIYRHILQRERERERRDRRDEARERETENDSGRVCAMNDDKTSFYDCKQIKKKQDFIPFYAVNCGSYIGAKEHMHTKG